MMKARDNPFATDRLERVLPFVPEWSIGSWQEIDHRLEKYGHRCAITGDHGAGKTTLLDALSVRFVAEGADVVRLFFNDGRPASFSRILELRERFTANSMVLCDGSELLGISRWRVLRWITRNARGLIVTAHDKARLPVAIRLTPSPELIAKLLRIVDPQGVWDAEALFAAHHGNVRSIFRACYFAVADGRNCSD